MTNAMQAPPSPLPKTLPAGTRYKYRIETAIATGELRLNGDRYEGPIRFTTNGAQNDYPIGVLFVDGIDWSSVPTPEHGKPRYEPGMTVKRTDQPELPIPMHATLRRRLTDGSSWTVLQDNGVGSIWMERYFEPATPPEPESDEAWLKRVVFELTGVDARVERGHCAWKVFSEDSRIPTGARELSILTLGEMRLGEPERFAECKRMLRGCKWPLKSDPSAQDLVAKQSPPVTGSVDAAHRKTAEVDVGQVAGHGSATPIRQTPTQPVAERTILDGSTWRYRDAWTATARWMVSDAGERVIETRIIDEKKYAGTQLVYQWDLKHFRQAFTWVSDPPEKCGFCDKPATQRDGTDKYNWPGCGDPICETAGMLMAERLDLGGANDCPEERRAARRFAAARGGVRCKVCGRPNPKERADDGTCVECYDPSGRNPVRPLDERIAAARAVEVPPAALVPLAAIDPALAEAEDEGHGGLERRVRRERAERARLAARRAEARRKRSGPRLCDSWPAGDDSEP